MNVHGRIPRTKLQSCPSCGMDSGERKIIDQAEELYIVICGTCGAHTKAYRTKGAETRAWNRGDITKKVRNTE